MFRSVEQSQQLLDRREMASVFGVPLAEINRMCRDGEIPSPLRIGKVARWRSTELFEWIDACKTDLGVAVDFLRTSGQQYFS